MASVVLELSDSLLEEAKANGLLNSQEYERFIKRRLWDLMDYPTDFPPELVGKVNPKVYGKGKINGDIIGPIESINNEQLAMSNG
jgi:hypothetical protein